MSPVSFEPARPTVSTDALAAVQSAQAAYRRRSIILFEGPEGAGKKHSLKRLAGCFDPCAMNVTRIERDRREAAEGHWLARFWRQLPSAGRTEIFYRSWYRRVLDDRLAGRIDLKQVQRAFDEINEFEAQQHDHGTLIVKLYFDVSPEVQQRRLAERRADPWTPQPPEECFRVDHPDYANALADLRAHSDMRWSPWTVIDGDDLEHAADLAMLAILEAYRAALPDEPPAAAEIPVMHSIRA